MKKWLLAMLLLSMAFVLPAMAYADERKAIAATCQQARGDIGAFLAALYSGNAPALQKATVALGNDVDAINHYSSIATSSRVVAIDRDWEATGRAGSRGARIVYASMLDTDFLALLADVSHSKGYR